LLGVRARFGQQKKGPPRKGTAKVTKVVSCKVWGRWCAADQHVVDMLLRAHSRPFRSPLRISRVKPLKCGFVKLALGIALLALVVGAVAGIAQPLPQ